MIKLTAMIKRDGNCPIKLIGTVRFEPLYLNPDYIIGISPCVIVADREEIGGSLVTMVNERTRMVKESPQEILELLKNEKQENAK